MSRTSRLYLTAAILSGLVIALAVPAWAQTGDWNFNHLSVYRLFPLFGLVAFSLLWAQYMILALALAYQVALEYLRPYFRISGWLVLGSILLHPSLLLRQLWKDGFGAPPGSLKHYVAAGEGWLATLGVLALLLFLAYELHRWFSNRFWWKYVFYASSVAMGLVFFHGLVLGGELMTGWYRKVWLVYGLSLGAAFCISIPASRCYLLTIFDNEPTLMPARSWARRGF